MSGEEKKLATADVAYIADQVIEKLNSPRIGKMLHWLVESILERILTVVPRDVVTALLSASDGLSPEEVERATAYITSRVVAVSHVAPDAIETMFVKPVVVALLEYAVRGIELVLHPSAADGV